MGAVRTRRILAGAVGGGEVARGRFVNRPYVNTPLRLRRVGIRKGTSRAPSPTVGSGRFSSVFNHPEGIPSCAMAQFMVKPIHAPRQFMPARAIHWPSAAMPPPAGCYVRNRKCLTTPPAFCPDKKPPPLTRGGFGCGANPGDIGRCGARGEHGKQPLSRGKGAV